MADRLTPDHRILAVDDEESMLELYRNVFDPPRRATSGVAANAQPQPILQLETLQQGEAAVEAVRTACAAGQPFRLAIIDMSMPPGIDGLETARRVRAIDPDVHIAIVSGFADMSDGNSTTGIPPAERFTVLAKPVRLSTLRNIVGVAISGATAA